MNFLASFQITSLLDRSRRFGQVLAAVSRNVLQQNSPADEAAGQGGSYSGPAGSAATSMVGSLQDQSPVAVPLLMDTQSLMDRIQTDGLGLTDICHATEGDFLTLGSRLNDIYTEARRLTEMVTAMLAADQGRNIQSTMKAVQTYAVTAHQELHRRRDLLALDLQGLQVIREDLAQLNRHNKNFKQVAKNLKMVGLNISIESARSEEAKAHFQVLAEEITQLAQTVGSVSGHIADDTHHARQKMERIEAEISARMNHLDNLILAAEQTVNRALQDVEALLQLTMSALDGIGAKALEISDQVGYLVVSIQIHDNISQRIAHIRSALDEAVHLIRSSTLVELPGPALRSIYGKACGMIRLQIAQLHVIIEDVAQVAGQCADALRKLQMAVQDIARPQGLTSQTCAETDLSWDGGGHPIMILKNALGQLVSLFDKGLNDIELLNEARRETGSTIAQMDRHINQVREINFDIHLKALNAVVKSTRLGATGKAIEAVVMEMKELAERSNATIVSTTGIMEKISSASDRMNEKERIQDTDQSGIDQQLRRGITEFSENCTGFRRQSEAALETGRALGQKIDDTQQFLHFFERLLTVGRRHLDDMRQIGEILKAFAGDVPEDWRLEENKILNRYTMNAERDAHYLLFNQRPGSTDNHLEPKITTVAMQQDFDDNVELF